MLRKLRSRHAIDVPAEQWGRRKPTLAILGAIALLFVVLPTLGALYAGATAVPIALGVAFAALVLVFVFAGVKGKPGWDR